LISSAVIDLAQHDSLAKVVQVSREPEPHPKTLPVFDAQESLVYHFTADGRQHRAPRHLILRKNTVVLVEYLSVLQPDFLEPWASREDIERPLGEMLPPRRATSGD
jgi:hypothetical protein